MSLNELGAEITEVNTLNGWNVITPADWDVPTASLEDWRFGEPHFVSCTGEQDDAGPSRWRVIAYHKSGGDVAIGSGVSKEQAREACEKKIRVSVDTYRIPAILALIHSEVSEALEEFRKAHRIEHFGEELADVIIRVLDCTAGLGIDIDAAVRAKLEVNRTRGFKHGGKRV